MPCNVSKPIDVLLLQRVMNSFLRRQQTLEPLPKPPAVADGVDVAFFTGIGLDVTAALARINGDKELYLWIVRSFVEEQWDAAQKTEEALAAGDGELAVRSIHTVKGIAGTMGAEGLQQLALILENAISRSEPPNSVSALLQGFAAELERLTSALKLHLAADAVPEVEQDATVDKSIVAPVLSALYSLIVHRDGKAERFLDDYQKELSGLPAREIGQIRTHLKKFNYDAAHDALLSFSIQHGITLATDDVRVYR